MQEAIRKLLEDASREISGSREDPRQLDQIRIRYLGRKGELAQLFKQLAQVPEALRRDCGKLLNEAKAQIEELLSLKLIEAKDRSAERRDRVDVTAPGRRPLRGRLHPITQTAMEICRIFHWLGFETVEGPEVELDYYNFEALNIPKDHPARDMQDTFYISEDVVLRTHTSPLQVRVMEKRTPPIRVIAPGRTYRCDSDVTHTPMFHQVEGLMVGTNISFGDLKGLLTIFVHQMFGPETGLRFRPSFFPFTEPSAEVDIECVMCRGKGCRVCSQTGWLEILGSGMVDPEVFKMVGYDPEQVTGFAFGMGIERIAMLKFGIDDLRLFFENDLRFLKQF
ncbi:MAG TPA: phenylalanine--tRNA ligase subunit alpha [Syntrophobacteraceae bacterium]|nr:phenylalanine--tRNA ligase subunit alpha [Syntrophobacteraceae bacterium]